MDHEGTQERVGYERRALENGVSTALDISKYRSGYSVSVGGIVVCGNKVLLVRRASEPRAGDWALPGGFVEHDETVQAAVRREVFEETGVEAEVEGLVAVLNRVFDEVNDTYLICLLRAKCEEARPDGVEVDRARFVTREELEDLPHLQFLTRMNVIPVLEGNTTVLPFYFDPFTLPGRGILYAAEGIYKEHQRMLGLLQQGQR